MLGVESGLGIGFVVGGGAVDGVVGGRKLSRAIFFNNLSIFFVVLLSFCFPPVKHNNGIIAKVSVQDLFFIFHGKKCCMEYVRNANYNIPGMHSEDDGW